MGVKGVIAILISCVGWGTNFVPVKKYGTSPAPSPAATSREADRPVSRSPDRTKNFPSPTPTDTGNGIYFQWLMCSAIVFVGMIINMIREGPQFYSLAAAGGALWCTGNM